MKSFIVIATAFVASMLIGCSSYQAPVEPPNLPGSEAAMPIESIGEISDNLGIMAVFEGTIMPDGTVHVTDPLHYRSASLGESYLVEGKSYFTIQPCHDCFRMTGFSFETDMIVLKFYLKHPFQPGNPNEPPSAKNRLDLDVFDVAVVVDPEVTPTSYPLTKATVYDSTCVEPDGYTCELASFTQDSVAMPYFLVIDDSDSGISTWNKFAMGAVKEFDVRFAIPDTTLRFQLFLTMGYGKSAKRATRLVPKYFNPEFNRKPSWKVVVIPPEGDEEPSPDNTWTNDDSTTTRNVNVKVWDWQIGATVYPNPPDFGNAPSDNVYAASEVVSVCVEIPGMNSALQCKTTPDSGDGKPNNPLIYTIPIANENLLAAGEYTSLVKVSDTRTPGLIPPSGDRDFLIHSPDGVSALRYQIPEYATYQTFVATVVDENGTVPTQFAYSSNRSGNYEIYLANTDGSYEENLTNHGACDYMCDFSPDGSKIYFNSDRDGNFDVWSLDLNTRGLKNVTHDPTSHQYACAVSPDGEWIVTQQDGPEDIMRLKADGSMNKSEWINLTKTPGVYEHEPDWSPDGSTICFYKILSGNDIWLMNSLDGSQLERLHNESGDDHGPKYSPCGNYIIYSTNKNDPAIGIYYWSFLDKQSHLYLDEIGVEEIAGGFSQNGEFVIFTRNQDIYYASFPDIQTDEPIELKASPYHDSWCVWRPE